jgi:fimbrial isopeptide formation D2 family protein/LPXTG-motif cell wall-anchored protein
MKHLRKILATAIAMIMSMAICYPALADSTQTTSTSTNKGSGTFSITMTGAEEGHTFKAYKIFDGSLSDDGTMGDISWSENVVTGTVGTGTTTIYDDIKTALNLSEKPSNAAAVATLLAGYQDDTDAVKAVADIFYARKGTVSTTNPAGTTSTKTGSNYVITPLTVGYYLVTDEYTNANSVADDAATLSRNILAVVGDVTAAVKNTKPSVEKKILTPAPKDANAAGIGDTVAFQITGKVPNYEGYVNYFYVINDTLSSGLTFDGAQNVVVKVGNTILTADTDYVVYTDPAVTNGHTFEIAFKHIKNYTIDKDIIVTYTATVNNNAVVGTPGNTNTTSVTYSNNPNDSSHGNPETNPKPDTDVPTGNSAPDRTVTYVAELDLTKYKDAIASDNLLAGATFTLTGQSTVVVGKGEDIYVANDNGAYWKLKDGTYTTTAPHGDIKDADGNVKLASNYSYYDATKPDQKYTLTSVTQYESKTEDVFMSGTSDDKGKIVFKGLGAGTYILTEVVTPTGYNTAAPITFTIVIEVPNEVLDGTEAASFSVTSVTPAGSVSVFGADQSGKATSGLYLTNVIDNSGSTLPSTGGIGTTIFYIVGGVMVAGAVVFLLTKRRMAGNE